MVQRRTCPSHRSGSLAHRIAWSTADRGGVPWQRVRRWRRQTWGFRELALVAPDQLWVNPDCGLKTRS